MQKVKRDFSRAHYNKKITDWYSLLIPVVRRILLKVGKPSFSIFGVKIITWEVTYPNADSYHIILKDVGKSNSTYRSDLKMFKNK